MKAIAAAVLACGTCLAWPASAQENAPPPSPGAGELVLRPLGGLIPAPPPGGMAARIGRASGVSEMREAPPPPPASRGAEFSFRRGPTEIRIRCGEQEPVKICADAALSLMSKFSTIGDDAPAARPPASEDGAAAPAQ